MCRKNTEIGKRIRQLRNFLGLTQREFAERIYSSYRSVQNWESGDRFISESNLRLLIDEYGVSADWIYQGTGEMFQPLFRKSDSDIFLPAAEIIKTPFTLNNPDRYAHIVVCDAMQPVISEGDIALWIKDDGILRHESFVFLIGSDGRPFIRKYLLADGEGLLVPENRGYEVLKADDPAVRHVGTVTEVFSKKSLLPQKI
ncbi:helix-turn-helix domain-containing protein [Geovibrio thiophilus]|uniref:Helix-turn-helix domain-containing protein n=1 Tax=Geovibrio thiophilus TaxID=139438 RepID=A0A3R5Z0N0_9BACT|nr:helix-turn-helix domain-containing protein [Geovibrio thiophilus]QAR34133.1 helix-turn-helix domain-containing protein [Geovibrio thiophilus]